jgi:hypothetical protein
LIWAHAPVEQWTIPLLKGGSHWQLAATEIVALLPRQVEAVDYRSAMGGIIAAKKTVGLLFVTI